MKKLTAALLALCCLAFFSAPPRANASDEGQYDVVIYDGTSAAVTCAVQVKKMGKSVVIVSPDSRLGGLSSGGLGHTDSGNRAVVGGLAREFYHRLWLYYQREDAWTVQPMPRENGRLSPNVRGNDNQTQTMWAFEPSAAEKTFEAFIDEYEIPVCCGFPVGSNSCIPLIEGAPCTLDVSIDKAMLSYNIKGNVEPYEVNFAKSNLIKEPDL